MSPSSENLNRRDLTEIDAEHLASAPHDAGQAEATPAVCRLPGCCGTSHMGRRTFVKLAGLGAAALTAGTRPVPAIAGPFSQQDLIDHCVPMDKQLSADWISKLTARGEKEIFRHKDLETIGMPVGGIGAGQLYIAGDGKLAHWDIFNLSTPGYGYPLSPAEVQLPLRQGFAVELQQGDGRTVRPLDIDGFPDVAFRGEYPVATVDYLAADFPLAVTLSAFSPFIPLNADDSSLPATVLQFSVKNNSDQTVRGTLAGWLQNGVCHESGGTYPGDLRNVVRQTPLATMLVSSARATAPQAVSRDPLTLADFEGDSYGDWQAEGTAFGTKPAHGTLTNQNPVDGFQGQGLVNTFLGGDQPHGKLTSPEFTISRRFLSFLVGGGNDAENTCIRLLVDGKVVRSAAGKATEHLAWFNWNVAELEGKQARIEIIDSASGPWGHINVDQIEMTDKAHTAHEGPLEAQPDFGTMALTLLGDSEGVVSSAVLPGGDLPKELFAGDGLASVDHTPVPLGGYLCGALGRQFELAAGQSTTITFVLTWHFPNRGKNGHYYASRFSNAQDIAQYVAEHRDRLIDQTRLWVDTYYDSTLPYWLLDRLHSTVSTLATSTCEIWKNGRFWAYEGVRCCHGTCGHVWNYEHALARLFPQLERSVREMQDFNPEAGYVEESGMIRFRGDWPDFWCGDAQTGYVLKALREHQTSADSGFLQRNWPRIRKAIEFLLVQDDNRDGLIEGEQHNTYDINFFGPNPMIGTLYLAALRAGEQMAQELDDEAFAQQCRQVFESGTKLFMQRLYNDEYFIQIVDLQKHPKYQHGDGCLSDQMFGQGWAHQVGLGYVLPKEAVQKTLQSIWKYNWALDIDAQNKEHPPQRWFAYPGEAGLFTCTWPKSKHLGPESVLYRDEIWTGIEYQVAGHMAWEGQLTEALAWIPMDLKSPKEMARIRPGTQL